MAQFIGQVSNVLYSYILIILLVAGGIYFTIRTKFVQFRLLKDQIKNVTEKSDDKKGASSFQALMVSTASRVGTGNIMGVAAAIISGGFGSMFWMWVIAIIGGASAFIESTLAQIYKKKGPNGCYGGPAYYIESALKSRVLAIVFSILLILTYGVGFNMLASYNLQSTFEVFDFYVEKTTCWIIGGIVALLVCYCLFGGGKRIIKLTSFLVPIMGIVYIVIAFGIMIFNITALPGILAIIFAEAFNFQAIFGGILGSCLIFGIRRGLFSNEAGVGSAPNASASADVSHPVKQGLVQVLSVFLDTLLVCSATAFMCMCSGLNPADFKTASGGADYVVYVQSSLSIALGDFGPIFIAVAMVLFAFTTLLGNLFYVEKAMIHIFKKDPPKWIKEASYLIFSLLIFIGAGSESGLLWDLADVLMGGMALINIPVIIILGKKAYVALNDYVAQKKAGKEPVFLAKTVGLEGQVDCWQEDGSSGKQSVELSAQE